jgi:hypothetical protein
MVVTETAEGGANRLEHMTKLRNNLYSASDPAEHFCRVTQSVNPGKNFPATLNLTPEIRTGFCLAESLARISHRLERRFVRTPLQAAADLCCW